MVYGKYDPAYILPNCDLCGEQLQNYDVDLEIEIETVSEDRKESDIHEGHLCEDCNEFEPEFEGLSPDKVEYQMVADNPTRIVQIDVLGCREDDSSLSSISTYEPDEVPEFLECLGYGIGKQSQLVNTVVSDNQRIDAINERFYQVVKEVIYGIDSSD